MAKGPGGRTGQEGGVLVRGVKTASEKAPLVLPTWAAARRWGFKKRKMGGSVERSPRPRKTKLRIRGPYRRQKNGDWKERESVRTEEKKIKSFLESYQNRSDPRPISRLENS